MDESRSYPNKPRRAMRGERPELPPREFDQASKREHLIRVGDTLCAIAAWQAANKPDDPCQARTLFEHAAWQLMLAGLIRRGLELREHARALCPDHGQEGDHANG